MPASSSGSLRDGLTVIEQNRPLSCAAKLAILLAGLLLFCFRGGVVASADRVLTWLGRISYSIYLFHHVVMIPLGSWVAWESNAALRGWLLPLYLIIMLLVTSGVSAAVFYAVELPAIKLGKRLAGRRATELGMQAP